MKTTIPNELNQVLINLKFPKKQLNKAYKLCSILFSRYQYGISPYDYITLPSNYLDEIFGQSYHRFFNTLKSNNIIETYIYDNGKSFSVKEHTAKAYRINPIYISNNWVSINISDINNSNCENISYNICSSLCGKIDIQEVITDKNIDDITAIIKPYICSSLMKPYICSSIHNNLSELIINEKSLSYIMDTIVDGFNVKPITEGSDNKVLVYYVDIKNNVMKKSNAYSYTLNDAIKLANDNNKSLIKSKNRYYICNLDEYIKIKKELIKFSYSRSIARLVNQDYNIFRNETNNRLDTNLTNLPGALLDKICVDNKLCQLDVSNSQFAILGHILLKEYGLCDDDVMVFFNEAKAGTLYEYMVKELNLTKKSEAKQMMFELFFSKNKDFSYSKERIRKLFPNVYDFVYRFKEENNYKQFAILLQKFESKLMIDDIYYKVINENFWCLSVHDSLICKIEDKDIIENIILEAFNKIDFECTLHVKISDLINDIPKDEPTTIEEEIIVKTALDEAIESLGEPEEYLLNQWVIMTLMGKIKTEECTEENKNKLIKINTYLNED